MRDALAFGKACPQLDNTLGGKLETDEDCLTLNVWAPHHASRLPVMVWIHGGGLTQGGSSIPFYDGAHLAGDGHVVVVSINYRLGPLGFFAHPALTAEDTHHASGNYGLLDQIAALRWVASNIAAFGGDAGNVTIFGESAGGESVCALMASSLANGLYARGIIESAQCVGDNNVPGLHTAVRGDSGDSGEAQGERIAAKLGCTGADALACLRGKSVDEIVHASPARLGFLGKGEHYGLIVDGYALKASPGALLEAGQLAHVPVMIGTNADEGALFTSLSGATDGMTRMAYFALVAKLFPGSAEKVIMQYAPRTFGSSKKALDALMGDVAFVCPTRRDARGLSQYAPVYRYEFSHPTAAEGQKGLAATHGDEVPYVFGTKTSPSDAERALSRRMQEYWTQFARTGNPMQAGAPAWPAYDATHDRYLELDTTISARDGLHAIACDLLDSLQPHPSE